MRILVTATVRGWRKFHSEFTIVRLLFNGGVCLKKYGIQRSRHLADGYRFNTRERFDLDVDIVFVSCFPFVET